MRGRMHFERSVDIGTVNVKEHARTLNHAQNFGRTMIRRPPKVQVAVPSDRYCMVKVVEPVAAAVMIVARDTISRGDDPVVSDSRNLAPLAVELAMVVAPDTAKLA